MKTLPIVLASLALAACGHKDSSAPAPASSAGSAGSAASSGAAAAAVPAPAAKKSVKELLTGKAPTLPAPAAALSFGMPIDAAKQAAPALFAKPYAVPVDGVDGATISIDLDQMNAHVRAIRLGFADPVDAIQAALTAAWGAPRTSTDGAFWNNPGAGVRANLDPSGHQIVYTPVQSLDQVLGSEHGKLGFEKAPLLGASVADVQAALPQLTPVKDESGRLTGSLIATEVSQYEPSLDVTIKDGKVAHWSVQLSYSFDPAAKDKILAALADKFGKPKTDDPYLDYPGPPPVKVDPSGDSIVIFVGKQ